MSPDNPELEDAESDENEGGIAKLTDGSSTRRRFLVTTGAVWTSASVAGCSQDQGAATATETGTATATATAEPTSTAPPTPEPPENYVVTDDMAAGSEGIPAGASFVSSCAPTRKFIPGMHAVWHVGVYDPETGEQLSNDTLDGITVEFTNRDWDPAELQWAGDDEEHPSEEWNGSKTIPEGTEAGTVQYTINISNGDANYRQVGIAANEFEIIEYTDEVRYVVSNYTYAVSAPDVSNGFVSACGPEWQFMPGMTVAFAANVYNADTGKEPGTDVIENVMVQWKGDVPFDDVELAWQGDAEENAAKVWEGTMDLPEDVSTGTYAYTIAVTTATEGETVVDTGIATDQITVINPNA